MATKISITLDDAELAFLRRRAKEHHAGNLSAAVLEAARLLRRQAALRSFLEEEGVPRLDASELAAIQEEWHRPTRPTRRTRKGHAA